MFFLLIPALSMLHVLFFTRYLFHKVALRFIAVILSVVKQSIFYEMKNCFDVLIDKYYMQSVIAV